MLDFFAFKQKLQFKAQNIQSHKQTQTHRTHMSSVRKHEYLGSMM